MLSLVSGVLSRIGKLPYSQVSLGTAQDVTIHVDAASGGFVAPFVRPDLVWDFRLPLVSSINTSGHK